jgi:hypothetical protein
MIDWFVWGIAAWWVAGMGWVAFSMYDGNRRHFALWERELGSLKAQRGP